MNTMCVIPARLESTRLPNKLLLDYKGKPLIQHTWERARQVASTFVAVDSDPMRHAVSRFGGNVIKTVRQHQCGTSRVYEAVSLLSNIVHTNCDAVIVNVQGDEVRVDPDHIQKAIDGLLEDDSVGICTVAAVDMQPKTGGNVYVTIDGMGRALSFSRQPVENGFYHVGVYAYRKETLSLYNIMASGGAERREKLEQLRFMYNQIPIKVVVVSHAAGSINTQQDYDYLVQNAMTGDNG